MPPTCGNGWWACQDLNLGPRPYQDCPGDAFMLAEGRWPAHGRPENDRGCPLDTGLGRPMWHASGTACENEVARTLRRWISVQPLDEADPRLLTASLASRRRRRGRSNRASVTHCTTMYPNPVQGTFAVAQHRLHPLGAPHSPSNLERFRVGQI